MCGLVWKVGVDCSQSVPIALQRLEYRGYDSFGFASLLDVGIELYHSLDDLRAFDERLPSSEMVLGHTRWATHGGVSLENCHPHIDVKRRFALAHNGIVENYERLSGGSKPSSDSALLALLISAGLDSGLSQKEAFVSVIQKIEGRNSIVVMFEDGEVYGYRLGSPLVLTKMKSGVGVSSDPTAFGVDVTACCPITDGAGFAYCNGELCVYPSAKDFGGLVEAPIWQDFDVALEEDLDLDRGPGSDMKREILEQWKTLVMPVPDADDMGALLKIIEGKDLILVTGAGGAALVAEQVAYLLQTQSDCPALAISAGEMQRFRLFAGNAVLLAISQSGETADTLTAIDLAKRWQMPVVSLVNGAFSSMGRASDLCLDLRVGPERCVLSTKSATAQIAFGYWLAGLLKRNEAGCNRAEGHRLELQSLGRSLTEQLDEALFTQFKPVVSYLADQSSVFLLGREADFASAALGALNLKEATYIHAEAFSAGELKHGVIALIELGTPVIVFGLGQDPYMSGVVAELKCRGAFVISVGRGGDLELPEFGDGHPVTTPITCQILSYLLARERGVDPDRPRNLAKSVTVL